MANAKLVATAQSAAETLALRTGLSVAYDLSGTYPTLTVGAVAASTNVGVSIRVYDQRATPDDTATYPAWTGAGVNAWQALPGFGAVAQPVYTGTTFQIFYEIGAGGAGSFYFGFANLLQVIGDLTKRGGRVELWSITNGNPPAIDGVGAAPVAAFEPNLYYPLQGRS